MTTHLLSAQEAAKILRMSVASIYIALREGRLEGFQIADGGEWRVKTTDEGLPRWKLPHHSQ